MWCNDILFPDLVFHLYDLDAFSPSYFASVCCMLLSFFSVRVSIALVIRGVFFFANALNIL